MYVVVSILILIVSILLGLIVLVQNSKGGGLASNFGQGNQFMGVRQTADFLEKATWVLAIALLVCSLVASMSIPRYDSSANQYDTEIREQIENTAAPVDLQTPPTQTEE